LGGYNARLNPDAERDGRECGPGAREMNSAMRSDLNEGFTVREKEVLGFLLEGLGDKEIAVRLAMKQRTVKFHVSRILLKTGKPDRKAVIAGAVRELQSAIAGRRDAADLSLSRALELSRAQ
jgi:DNA-binding NarL/FixJ family response regulator